MSVSEAARTLKVSPQAIHGRIRRDTIRHETGENGNFYVYLTDEELGREPPDNSVEKDVLNEVVNSYITSLKSEIETLRTHNKSLETDREEWKEEARRKDTIIMALTNRIPELPEASSEAPESSVSAPEDKERGDAPREPETRPWWRRIFE